MRNNLAIIIPAYKKQYLKEALQSIANQTCQKFTLYIGDDNSPEDLYDTVKAFTDKIQIVYKKFDENLGATDLVAHWERCINLSDSEEWIWLFSDDDIMDAKCVQLFYNHISNQPGHKLLHFNVNVIDSGGRKHDLYKYPNYPEYLSAQQFYEEKVQSKLHSFVVEYIFKRSVYIEKGKFERFDLAWCADDATWIKFAADGGIYTIQGACVYWRYSGINISSSSANINILIRKLNSKLAFLKWAASYLYSSSLKRSKLNYAKTRWLLQDLTAYKNIGILKRSTIAFNYGRQIGGISWGLAGILYSCYKLIKD